MAAFTSIALAIGAAASVAGTVMSVVGASKQAKAQKKAEELREKQMNLDADRQKRQAIREGIVARSRALTTATNQGAAEGSGLQGGYAQITGEQGRNVRTIEQSRDIGAGIFSANRDAAKGGTLASFGSGLSSLGGMLMNNSGTIGRVGTYYAGGGGFSFGR